MDLGQPLARMVGGIILRKCNLDISDRRNVPGSEYINNRTERNLLHVNVTRYYELKCVIFRYQDIHINTPLKAIFVIFLNQLLNIGRMFKGTVIAMTLQFFSFDS